MRRVTFAALIVLAAGCALPAGGGSKRVSMPSGAPVGVIRGLSAPAPYPEATVRPELAPVISEAEKLIGATSVRVNGQSFRYDCSGFVRGVFSTLGVDVFALGTKHPDYNGVRLVHEYLERHGENHKRQRPSPGDVVYWDATVDKNNDGEQNDPLTHIGLVTAVDEDGTITFIHRNNKGIVKEVMNVLRPSEVKDASGKRLNDYLRGKKKRDPAGSRHLAGELWAGFGTLTELPRTQPMALLSWAYWPERE